MAKAAIATFGKTLATCPNCKSEKPKEIVSRKNKLGLLFPIVRFSKFLDTDGDAQVRLGIFSFFHTSLKTSLIHPSFVFNYP